MQNITQRDTVVPLHGGSYFVRPLDTDPRTFNGDRDAAWRMDASDAFANYAESLQDEDYISGVPIFTADEFVAACVFGAIFGCLLTVGMAFVWAWIGA
jgi:hypothetical protein